MGCLDANALVDIFAGARGGGARDQLELHLDACEACRNLVAAYARVADEQCPAALADTEAGPTDSPAGPADAGAGEPPTPDGESPTQVTRPLEAGDLLAGRFRLERVVGEGGMGIVWQATDVLAARPVALKLLRLETPELTRRTLREAWVSATVSHPNIVEVHEVVWTARGAPVLVMDLLRGESLDKLLLRRGRLDVAETVGVLLPLVGAVRAAHARGVLHRDLKPQNVFLADDGAGPPVVMLLDFGLAKLLSGGSDLGADALTRSGAIVGTPHYMAPEQLYGDRAIDRRADVWSIGALAYECLSGKRAIEGRSYGQIVRALGRGRITPLAAVAPHVPEPLARVILAMLSPERDDRPELAEVHAVLDACERAGA